MARRGFVDAARAVVLAERLDELHHDGAPRLVDRCSAAIDPDLALATLVDLLHADPLRIHSLVENAALADRLIAVLGGSSELGRHLAADPRDLDVLAAAPSRHARGDLIENLLGAVGATADHQVATLPDAPDRLRIAYRRQMYRIAARDLTAPEPLEILPDIAGELTDLADAAMAGALAIARAAVPDHAEARFAILGLGKTGAQELNYISDVDVLYVAEPALDDEGKPRCTQDTAVAIGTRLAAAVTRACSDHTRAGTIWQVDAALRPEGKAGPLVRTLSSMKAYYTKWAKTWEFQAMLKARPMAGDLDLGQEFCDLVAPLVWTAGERENFLVDTQAMRRRVISLIPAKEADREIKLGVGGLRDTEFTVQLLQLVHGRTDERLRLRATLPALQALIDHGYVGRQDGARMAEAYRFQRLLEHRVQLFRMRRTHLLPDDAAGLRRLARATSLGSPEEVVDRWRASARTVQRLHTRLFYSPLLEAVARIPSEAMRLTTEAARTRLAALGYADPAAALRHIEALSTGMSRHAEIQRQLLPAMLGWFAEGPSPDHGLLAFRQVSEALGSTPWYLRALRDEGLMAERMAVILSSSRYAVDLMRRSPQAVQHLTDDADLAPRSLDELRESMTSALARNPEGDRALESVQMLRRAELLRVAMGDVLHRTELEVVGRAITDIADATVDATLELARREIDGAPPIAVIAMGRWGGSEMSYGSDADAMFVVADTDDPGATGAATQLVARLRAMLRQQDKETALEIDPDLRPEGKGGPLVRTLSSYRAYYARWSATWEAQALLRADFAAGDKTTGELFSELIAPIRYPEGGLTQAQVVEIRRLKARMEGERLPRGVDASRHVKLGPGGLSDVEWTVQLLQLQHAHAVPALRTPRTLAALRGAAEADLVAEADVAALEAAWVLAGRIRNTSLLVRGRASDVVPTDVREMAQVAELLGYGRQGASHLLDDWQRRARRAKQVTDRLFYGLTEPA
jgi:glutamate-ammonia-ligase adenylyltransferase